MVDAGHGGEDPGAVHQGRQEKNDNLKLAMEVGKILQSSGMDVEFTRTTDVYQTPFEKAQLANQSGADHFISIHRNSSPQPNQYSGVESLIYDKSDIKLEIAENINEQLANVGFNNLGVKERPGLVILRRTQMSSVLVEVGFINSDADNQLFDSRFNDIAKGIAAGLLETINQDAAMETPMEIPTETPMETPMETPVQIPMPMEPPTYYRVQVGTYRVRQNADNMLYELLEKGYPAFILYDDGFYKVQVGAFQQLGNALIMERKLRHDGYNTLITTH